jgi:peptide deformylase
MAVNILYKGSPILKTVSEKVAISIETFDLVEDLKHAVRFEDKVWTFTGLSICAVQIGVPKRVMILGRPLYWAAQRHHQAFDVLINPEITGNSKEVKEEWEGCLSIPGLECLVPRFSEVTVRFLNLSGKICEKVMKNTLARVIQHEIDHMDGKFMTQIAVNSRKKQNHLK